MTPQPGTARERVPLYNTEIEAALIALIMCDNSIMASACADLEPEHFHEGIFAELFGTCRGMIAKGGRVSAVTLNAYYQTNQAIQEMGGAAFFARLAANATAQISAPGYARVIRDLYVRRKAVEEAEMAISDLETMPIDETGADYAANMAQRLSELAAQGISRKTRFIFAESVGDAIDHAVAAYQYHGQRPDAVPSRIPALDNLLGGFVMGDLVIIAGRPAMGKTALAIEIARLSAMNGVPCDYSSLEMAAYQLGVRVISASMPGSKVPYQRILWGKFSEAEFDGIMDAANAIKSWPLTIIDQDRMTLAGLRSEIARSKARRPDTRLIIIDYLGLIQSGTTGRASRVDEVGQITAELKRMARQFQVVLIVLAQLSRGVEQRENKRPQLSDLRESGSIEQDADLVIFPFREAYYLSRDEPKAGTAEHIEWQDRMAAIAGYMEIIVAKNRQGRTGAVKVRADMAVNTFHHIEENQPEMF